MKNETVKLSEISVKRAVSTKTGEDLGRIRDVKIDLASGTVTEAVVCEKRRIFGLFCGGEHIVPWKNVRLVGKDAVLVDSERPKDGDGTGDKKVFGLFE